MAISATRVTVDTTADVITDASTDLNGYRVCVRNRGSVAVHLGGSNVLTTTGFQLDAGESVSFYVDPSEVLYGITASSSAVVHVLKGGGV